MKGRTGLNIAAGFIEPMLCLAVDKLPEGPALQYEARDQRNNRRNYDTLNFKVRSRIHISRVSKVLRSRM